jgi:anti-sigma B factor antagonist
MKIERKKNKDTSTFTLEGELTIYNVTQAKQEIFSDHEKLPEKIAVDLHQVTEIDTAGVQLLLFAKHFFAKANKSLFISKSNESVDAVLNVLNVNSQFSR